MITPLPQVMARRTVETNDRIYTFAPDDAPPAERRLWGVVQARVVDELTGRPPLVPLRLDTPARGFFPRVAAGGLLGLVARPGLVFPALAERSYDVPLTIRAEGFLPRRETATVPASPLCPRRTIDPATDPLPGDTVLTLGSVDGLATGGTLLVGRPGNRERVQVQSVNAAARQVTVAPALAADHAGGDPVVAEQLVPFDPAAAVLDLGDVALHRLPVAITGRVLRRVGGTLTPVPGATVAATGLWRVLVPAAVEPPAEAPDLVSLDPPLVSARTAAAGRLRRREMTPVAGEDKALLGWVDAGDDRLDVSDRINLNPGDILLLDADPAVQEFVTVAALEPPGGADMPATLTLTHATAHSHRPGARVRRVVAQAPGPNRQLARDAVAGDTCLYMNSLAGLAGVAVVEVFGGAAPPEYHRLRLFSVVTGPDGRYTLPPLSRVAKLELEATEAGDTSGPVSFVPHYPTRENVLDLELS